MSTDWRIDKQHAWRLYSAALMAGVAAALPEDDGR